MDEIKLGEKNIPLNIKFILELPSGTDLRKKINENIKSWQIDCMSEAKNGIDLKILQKEYEERIKNNIKLLVDKMYLFIHCKFNDGYHDIY